MREINGFGGPNRYLSNMFPALLTYKGLMFSCSEAAYQAEKCADPEERHFFRHINGYEAKAIGHTIKQRPDWLDVRVQVMEDIVRAKFTQYSALRAQLLATGDALLVEGNTWGDTFWGECDGVGENHLGKILMKVRDEFRRAGV